MGEAMKGYVYILSNPEMPGLLKIGRSIHGGRKRAGEIDGTGVPAPFELEFEMLTSDCAEAEGWAHDALADFRVSSGREFFKINLETAAQAVVVACCHVSDIGEPQFFDTSDFDYAAGNARLTLEQLGHSVARANPASIRHVYAGYLWERRQRERERKAGQEVDNNPLRVVADNTGTED